jgi:predicted transcriptional regulator
LDLWLTVLALLALVAVGMWAFSRVKRWREEIGTEPEVTPQEQLEHYQKMVDDGLLDPQEFAVIKARMEAAPTTPPQPVPGQPPDTSK